MDYFLRQINDFWGLINDDNNHWLQLQHKQSYGQMHPYILGLLQRVMMYDIDRWNSSWPRMAATDNDTDEDF